MIDKAVMPRRNGEICLFFIIIPAIKSVGEQNLSFLSVISQLLQTNNTVPNKSLPEGETCARQPVITVIPEITAFT